MRVLAISYAKRVLEQDSREQKRMLHCANEIDEFVMVVFTRKRDNLPKFFHQNNMTVYGTNARTRVGVFFTALYLSLKLSFQNKKEWVVSSQDVSISGLLAFLVARIKGIKLHVQIHGDPLAEVTLSHFSKKWILFLLRRATKIRVVSDRVANSLKRIGVSHEKIVVLPVYSNINDSLKIGKKRVYTQQETTTFLFVGRFETVKNIDLLLQAFAVAYKQQPMITLRLVGEGALKASLQEQVKALQLGEVVKFMPWTEDIAAEMSQADVFVLASKHEGYGLVLLEAAAAGLPIVTTDVGCVGEVILDGVHGLVVEENKSEMAEALLRMAQSTEVRAQYGKAGVETGKKISQNNIDYTKRWRDSFVTN